MIVAVALLGVPSTGLNPFFQVGDFDGDRRLDTAVFVRDSATDKEGVLMLLRARPWRVESRPGRDQLVVEKSESASGAITWDGRGYRWTQLAD